MPMAITVGTPGICLSFTVLIDPSFHFGVLRRVATRVPVPNLMGMDLSTHSVALAGRPMLACRFS